MTYGWCRSAYTVVRALGARGVQVHVGDHSRLAMSRFSRHASSFTELPDFFSEPERYARRLGEALRATGARVLLPCSEDVEVVIRHRDLLPDDVLVAVPSQDSWIEAEDKWTYVACAQAVGCPVPETWKVSSEEELRALAPGLPYPVFVKVRLGNGARGVESVSTSEALISAVLRIARSFSLAPERWPIIQRRINGKKLQMDGVFADGRHVATGIYEVLKSKGAENFGTSVFRVTVDEAAVVSDVVRVLERLSWSGMYNAECVVDDQGVAHLIDINGRLGGAVSIVYRAGVDLPWLWYCASAGRDIGQERVVPQTGVRARWLLGDAIAVVEHMASGELREALRVLPGRRGVRYDDLVRGDPVPFAFEVLDYAAKFFGSHASLKPTVDGMVR